MNTHSLISPLCVALTIAISCTERDVQGSDWPQFRGPNCTGLAEPGPALPVKFSSTEQALWTDDIGEGVGCPIVADGRVFVSSAPDKLTIRLLAFELKTGKKLWSRDWDVGDLPEIHETNCHASTTPAADADRVYFYSSTLGMTALDAKTGAEVWHEDLPTPFYVFKWGPAMSPVLYKDKLLFCQDDDLHPAFYAFDKKTGKILWKDDRGDMAVNYSHPVIASTDKGDEIVVAGTGLLVGYDPSNGKRIWHAQTLLRNIKTTPVVRDGVIYISLQSSGIANQWLATADRSKTGNNDNRLSKKEMQAFVGDYKIPQAFYERTFDRGDLNKDGFLVGKELDLAFLPETNFAGAAYDAKDPADEFVMAIRAGGRGDVTKTHVMWKHKTKYTDHIVSPLVVDQNMFLIKEGGITTIFDTDNGKSVRDAKRISNSGQYFASPIMSDNKIFIAAENGIIAVLNAKTFETLALNDMGDSIVGTPAIADGRLIVRTRNRLLCIGNKD